MHACTHTQNWGPPLIEFCLLLRPITYLWKSFLAFNMVKEYAKSLQNAQKAQVRCIDPVFPNDVMYV